MKKASAILLLFCTTLLMNCERNVYLETGLTWSDDSYFVQDGNWYLAVSEGCYSNCMGASLCVVDQVEVTPGENVIERFVLGSGAEGNVTSFVYLDVNANQIYDDGTDLVTGYKYNYSEAGNTTAIAVSAYF